MIDALFKSARPAASLVATVALIVLVVYGSAPAAAAAPTVTPAVGSVSEAADYATENWADPWDFSNAEDMSLTLNVQSSAEVTNKTMNGGVFAFDTTPGGFIQPLGASGVLAHNRDGDIHPIDTSKYTRVSFRMWSSSGSILPGGIFWFNCANAIPQCQGAMPITLLPGWNTYDMALAPTLGGIPWSGEINVFRIMPSSTAPVHIEIDWIRLYQPGSSVTLTVQGGNASEVWWDEDSDTGNNDTSTIGGRGAGRISYFVPNGGTTSFPASAFPPGQYRFFTKQSGQVSEYSSPMTLDSRPVPQVTDPDIAGGDDYATVVRGDPWDFSQPTDATYISSAVYGWGGWYLQGSYGGPYPNDPQVGLPIAGSIDASTYHRLTYRIGYDGPFGTDNSPGGGMVSRVIWTVNQGGVNGYHDSQDMIVFPGWQMISVDLKTNPPSLAEDESSTNPIGWGGPASGTVTSLRFDPHEDPGGRTWYLDDIRLARNDRGTPYFNIRFRDNAWEAGTTAEIWADSDSSGYDGTQIASGISVEQGENTYNWSGAGVGPGTWWIYVVLRDADGTETKAYSTGPVDMSGPPVDPFGNVDTVSGAPGGLQVTGWAIDPDTTDPIDVHIYVDGQYAAAVTANQNRPDVGDAYPGSGPLHGFTTTLSAAAGSHTVCAYGINVGAGSNKLLACRTGTVPGGNPIGSVDSVATGTPWGELDVTGWAIDPDTASPIDVHLYVNGHYAGAVTANADRPDVGSAYPAYGSQHGYTTIAAGATGSNTVCAYGINTGSGANALIGCKTYQASWESSPPTPPPAGYHYYWTWYDNKGGSNYVLMASPFSGGPLDLDLNISGRDMGLTVFGGPAVSAGETLATSYSGLRGGPVIATSTTGAKAVASQRILWPLGGSSIEEVLPVEESRLSDRYYWPWYDQQSLGFTNWVLVANISSSDPVYYEITIDGQDPGQGSKGTIAPGQNVTPTFSGKMGGPVEVRAWTDSSKTLPADVIASQRVLSNYGTAFNEAPGVPREELSNYYLWPFYDNVWGKNWILLANPSDAAGAVTYEIKIAGSIVDSGSINPGEEKTPRFSGKIGGPVEVTASDNIIASQRSIFGPSFGETPGIPQSALASSYHWTWYDNVGGRNWVLLANKNASSVYYEVFIAGSQPVASGTIGDDEIADLIFSGKVGGPVEVRAWTDSSKTVAASVIASQRVLWNGYFNEVPGTVLN